MGSSARRAMCRSDRLQRANTIALRAKVVVKLLQEQGTLGGPVGDDRGGDHAVLRYSSLEAYSYCRISRTVSSATLSSEAPGIREATILYVGLPQCCVHLCAEGGCTALYDVWRVWLYGCMPYSHTRHMPYSHTRHSSYVWLYATHAQQKTCSPLICISNQGAPLRYRRGGRVRLPGVDTEMADEEVDFEETVELGDAPMEEAASSGSKNKGRDATGRRLKGRGAAGSSTTMQDKDNFDSIEKGGSVKGPAKCEPCLAARMQSAAPLTGRRHLCQLACSSGRGLCRAAPAAAPDSTPSTRSGPAPRRDAGPDVAPTPARTPARPSC